MSLICLPGHCGHSTISIAVSTQPLHMVDNHTILHFSVLTAELLRMSCCNKELDYSGTLQGQD